jgi:hypothetical protein
LLPFPDGKDFAVTFIDDTDLSTRENTEPVYDFLHSMNMKGTKTVWTTRQKRTSAFRKKDEKPINSDVNNGLSLEYPDYLSFILDLKKRGFEIALHGVAAGNSYRGEVIQGLERFKALFGEYPKINVFHERNIENLYAGSYKLNFWPFKVLEKIVDKSEYQGHIEGSPYFWGDIAAKTIKYIRLPFHTISEINTLNVNPRMPFYDPRRPYVNYWFSSSDGSHCQRFVRLLSNKNIDKLRKEHGACLIYTHFAKGFAEKKNGPYRLNERFVDVIMKLASHSNAWFPIASELLDRLLILKAITLEQHNFDVTIKNEHNSDIEGLTLKADPTVVLTDYRGMEHRPLKYGKIIIDKLPAKSSVFYKSNKRGDFVVSAKKNQSIPRWERIKIEFYNYYGLLKQSIS